jgi:thiazolinyl imide reductase
MTGSGWRPRVLVCGTGFGRTYLAALRRPGMPFELCGILARGSDRSRACARHYQVPLFTDIDQIPSTVDIACVVVNAAINGGPGARLAQDLLARGAHVLQEHPLHATELAECLRQARRTGRIYHLNTHYVHVPAVAAFIRAARRLLPAQAPVFVDAVTGFQVLYTLVDILGRALDGLRPWSLAVQPGVAGEVLRAVHGTVAGVPTTLRVQNQLDPAARDNGAHVMHRITLATEGGNLLLANTHGPVLWCPRLHMPDGYADVVDVADCPDEALDLPAALSVTGGGPPTHRDAIGAEWPRAAATALLDLRRAILAGEDPLPNGQYQLAVARLVADLTGQLGRPELVAAGRPRIVQAAGLARDPAGAAERSGKRLGEAVTAPEP